MRRTKITGLSGKTILASFVESITWYLGPRVSATVDLGFIIGSAVDLATWCPDASFLKHDPVTLLADYGIPRTAATNIFNELVNTVIALATLLLQETDCDSIWEIRIDASYYMVVIMHTDRRTPDETSTAYGRDTSQ